MRNTTESNCKTADAAREWYEYLDTFFFSLTQDVGFHNRDGAGVFPTNEKIYWAGELESRSGLSPRETKSKL